MNEVLFMTLASGLLGGMVMLGALAEERGSGAWFARGLAIIFMFPAIANFYYYAFKGLL